MIKRRVLIFIGFLVFLLHACGTNEQTAIDLTEKEAEGQPLTLATNIYAIEDFMNIIGGEHVNVINLVPAGTDAHTYEPTIQEVITLAEADGFLYTEGSMEGLTDTILPLLRKENTMTMDVAENIERIEYQKHERDQPEEIAHSHSHSHSEKNHVHEHTHDDGEQTETHSHGPTNPHVWIDPIRAKEIAENIKDGLIMMKPELEKTFEENTESLLKELQALDKKFQAVTEDIDKHAIYVAHPGYTYWADRYGFEEISITETVASAVPSQKRMQRLTEKAKADDIHYVAFERSFPIKVAETFAEDIGASWVYLNNLESLHEVEDSAEVGYFSLMEENIESLNKLLNE